MSLCRKCNLWVDCGVKGFCLVRNLFTYTDKSECKDYAKGEPMKEKEYEEVNEKWLRNLMRRSTSREG